MTQSGGATNTFFSVKLFIVFKKVVGQKSYPPLPLRGPCIIDYSGAKLFNDLLKEMKICKTLHSFNSVPDELKSSVQKRPK